MPFPIIRNTLGAANLFSLCLAMSSRLAARQFIADTAKRYYEASRRGLPGKFPLSVLTLDPASRIVFPPVLHGGGGTSTEEILHLAAVTAALRPRCVFEIGTFTGLTTATFRLNAPDARVISLDLPPDADVSGAEYIGTDVDLVRQRKVGYYAHSLGMRYEQMFADSMTVDLSPLAGQVDLAFIDGAHALAYVRNDTEKVAPIMSDRGVILWHDYGGMGGFRPLSEYLEGLSQRAPLYRIPGTTLAWGMARDLRRALGIETRREIKTAVAAS